MAMGFIDGDHFDEGQCLDLLGRSRIGRVGLSIGAVPAVVPVRYELSGMGILVGCGVEQIAKAMDHAVVALQSDGFDEDARKRWTVLAIGRTQRMTGDELVPSSSETAVAWDVESVRRAPHLFRLEPGVLSGRWLDDF